MLGQIKLFTAALTISLTGALGLPNTSAAPNKSTAETQRQSTTSLPQQHASRGSPSARRTRDT
jgi:hypothetical protein